MIKKTDSLYIAGHTGLIGSALVRVFVGMGYGNLILRTRTELDLMNRLEVEKFFDVYRPKYVLLAAGKVGGIIENQTYPADFITSNLIIQSNVIAAAHQHEVETLVLFGSSRVPSAYGRRTYPDRETRVHQHGVRDLKASWGRDVPSLQQTVWFQSFYYGDSK